VIIEEFKISKMLILASRIDAKSCLRPMTREPLRIKSSKMIWITWIDHSRASEINTIKFSKKRPIRSMKLELTKRLLSTSKMRWKFTNREPMIML